MRGNSNQDWEKDEDIHSQSGAVRGSAGGDGEAVGAVSGAGGGVRACRGWAQDERGGSPESF